MARGPMTSEPVEPVRFTVTLHQQRKKNATQEVNTNVVFLQLNPRVKF